VRKEGGKRAKEGEAAGDLKKKEERKRLTNMIFT